MQHLCHVWQRLRQHLRTTSLLPLYLSLSFSLLYSSAFSCLLFGRQGGDWRKKASLSPIPNPQQALKHMNGGGPAAALSRCPNLSIILSLLQQRQQSHRSWCTVKAEKGAQHRLLVCPALCALRLGDPSHTANAPLLPSLLQLVCGGRYFYLCNNLPDAALLRKRSFLWLCLYPSLPGKGREVMEVGVGCCRCCWSRSPPLSHSLSLQFTSLHITHTHKHTKVWANYTRLRHQGEEMSICFLSRTGTATEPKLPANRSASISKLPKTHFTTHCIKRVHRQNLNVYLGNRIWICMHHNDDNSWQL